MHSSRQQNMPSSRLTTPHSEASANLRASDPDTRYFAYKLGYLSRTNIQREARKAEPRLHKLLGHATLFDNARKYISEHLEDEAEEVDGVEETMNDWDEEDDEPSFQYVEDIDLDEALVPSVQPVILLPTISSKDISALLPGAPRTLSVVHASPIASHLDHEEDWENDSDSSTEAEDEDDGHWSDSTCDGDDTESTHSESKIFDAHSMNKPNYSDYTCKHRPEEDDVVLWAQQPRVLSLRQVEDLFVEAFG